MSIQSSCPNCQARFKLDAELSGKKVRCQKCKAIFTVTPAADDAPAPPAALATPTPDRAAATPPPLPPSANAGEVVFSTPVGSPNLGNLLLQDLLGGAGSPPPPPPSNPPPAGMPAFNAPPAAPMPPSVPALDTLEELPAPPPAAMPTHAAPPDMPTSPSPQTSPVDPSASPPSAATRARPSGWTAGTITLATVLYLSCFLGGVGGLWVLAAKRANDVSPRIPRHFHDGNRAIAIKVPSVNGIPNFNQHSNLDFSDPQFNDNFARYKVYEVTLEANQSYFVEMRSHSFDTRLVLLDENGAEVMQNEGSNRFNGVNGESRASFVYFSPRRAKYLILATAHRNNGMHAFGPFQFRIQRNDAVAK